MLHGPQRPRVSGRGAGGSCLPTVAAAVRWNPLRKWWARTCLVAALPGHLEDPATGMWAREQLRRTTLTTAVSAIQAVCEFTSHGCISQVDIPTAVVVTV